MNNNQSCHLNTEQMIRTSAVLNTSSVALLDLNLVYSCSDLSLSCRVDLVSTDLISLFCSCIDYWKSGKALTIIFCGGCLEEIFPMLEKELVFPVTCKVLEANRYRGATIIEEWTAGNINDLYRELNGGRSIKGLSITDMTGVFLTDSSVDLTIIPVQPKLTLKLDE